MFSAHRSAMCTRLMCMPQNQSIPLFSPDLLWKKPQTLHIICEVFCSTVLSRLVLFPQSWLKALQSYSQIKLSQLICYTMMFRQSFKYVWVWIEIKCYLWEICLLLTLDIAFGLLPITLLNYREFVIGFSLCPVFMCHGWIDTIL